MISYLLTSILLSGIGWFFYRLTLQKRGALPQRRRFIQIVILSSLIIPAFMPHKPLPDPAQAAQHQRAAFGMRLDHQAVQQHCRCVNPNYGHRISYRTNAFYNFILSLSPALTKLTYLFLALVLLRFLTQIGFLIYLSRNSRRETQWIGDQEVHILFPSNPRSVGAFWLLQPYIIWQHELQEVSVGERSAILAHELAHLKLGHPVEKAALKFIQCVWFLNPFFYAFQQELDGIAEFQADEAGADRLGDRKAYAHLLLNFKGQESIALARHFRESQLRKRIKRLVSPPITRPSRWSGLLLLPLLGLQLGIAQPVHQQIDQRLWRWEAYQKVVPHLSTERPEVLFCQDCESVCSPEE